MESQHHWAKMLCVIFSDDMVGTSEATSADRRRTLDEVRTYDFLNGVFSEASSADRCSDAVVAGVSMV